MVLREYCGRWLVTCLLAALPVSVHAGALAYAVATTEPGDNLYVVDVAAHSKTLVGITGVSNFLEGLALSPSGALYGTDTGGGFYSISTSTGIATPIGSIGRGDIEGLDFDGTTLLGINFVSGAPTIFSINLATAATTSIVTATSSTDFVGTMAVLDANDVLVAASPGGSTVILYSINLTTGGVTTIGTLAVPAPFGAMDFLNDGNLYGLDLSGGVWRINASTAAVVSLGNTGGDIWLDMTTGPTVPEPGTFMLLVVGLGSYVLRRKFATPN